MENAGTTELSQADEAEGQPRTVDIEVYSLCGGYTRMLLTALLRPVGQANIIPISLVRQLGLETTICHGSIELTGAFGESELTENSHDCGDATFETKFSVVEDITMFHIEGVEFDVVLGEKMCTRNKEVVEKAEADHVLMFASKKLSKAAQCKKEANAAIEAERQDRQIEEGNKRRKEKTRAQLQLGAGKADTSGGHNNEASKV